jgi:phosphotransferase system enzyme I (PtsI)
MEVIKGVPVAPGIVVGRAFVFDDVLEQVPLKHVTEQDIPVQLDRLEQALEAVRADLEEDRDRAAAKLGREPARVFEFHIGLLSDESLIEPVRQRIRDEKVIAAYAVAEAFRGLAHRFRAMGSEVFRQKGNDVLDLDRRLLAKLVGRSTDRLAKLSEPVLLIAHEELTPTQAASLDIKVVQGVATDAGGRTSHTSIMAAALGIPVVVGCQSLKQHVRDNDELIMDGDAGLVVVRPTPETLEQYQRDIERRADYRSHLRQLTEQEPVTTDGTRIQLMGNIEFAREIESVLDNGGDAVGLYRTEFLYLTSASEPTEEEHFQAYKRSLELLEGRSLILRTVDLGADKYTQQRAEEPERNPFLGLRSIRYALQNLPMFKTQLRAILRASVYGKVKVMFPLISTLMELRQAKMIFNDVMEQCADEGLKFDPEIPIGMMIEVPSAALMASVFAREVDFFSIGTNDLIQYTLAVDRGNERVANLYSASNPAVIQLVKAVVRAGKRFEVETSLCGEIAGETLYTMLLIGLGLRNLSLVPSQIPLVKQVIRAVDISQCERLARRVGSLDTERQVHRCLREELQKILPEMDGGWTTG